MSAAAASMGSNARRAPQLKVLWSHEDFVKVARELVQRYPECKFEQATTLSALSGLGRVQLETAMQEALPAHLHKRIKEAWRFKPGILRALRSMKEHAPVENNPHIVWTDEEWKRFAVLLQALHPTENFMRSPDLKNLKASHLNTAACEMPLPRQRIFTQVQKLTVARLLECYRAVLTENQRNIERQSVLTHATPAAPAAPVPDPAPAAPRSATVTALPAPKAGSKTKNGNDRRLRIFWTDAEWLAVAEQLVQQNPKDDFLADVLMKGLTARKVERAQETALPAERWRHLVGLEHLRSRLRMALNKLHRRAAEQEAGQQEAPQEMPPPEPAALIEPVPPAGGFDAAWREACRPLADLMTSQLASQALVQALLPQLIPQLVAGLTAPLAEAVRALLPPPAPAARALPFLNPPQPAGDKREVFIPPKADKPVAPAAAKLPVVGVVGPLPAQQRVLEAAYPQLKLLFVEKDNRGDVCKILRSCVRVVGMTSFMTHSIDGALKRHFQHRYGRVTGGVSAIKHQLDIWLKSGVLNERYADMLAN